jgi:tRNA dimethylallyltransferase
MTEIPLLIILGPTASGKTKLAVQLANVFDGEIISADSRQIFKGMDIGAGKDLEEYQIGEKKIPYHLIDIKNAGDTYNVNAFKEDFYQALQEISDKGKLPILCGGTGMYIHALLQNHQLTAIPINPQLRENLKEKDKLQLLVELGKFPSALTSYADTSSVKRLIRAIEIATYLSNNQIEIIDRPRFKPFVIGLQSEVEVRRKRILERLTSRIQNGLVTEVLNLLNTGVTEEQLVFYGLEYKFAVAYIRKELDLNEFEQRLGIAICQYAKRQMTFFRKMEKDGVTINWLNAQSTNLYNEAVNVIVSNFREGFQFF